MVQVVIAVIGATSDKHPMGDVIFAYKPWVDAMFAGGKWFGINAAWVYPYPALVPLLLAQVIAPGSYLTGWLVLAIAVNEAALWFLLWRFRAAASLGWFWLAATVALGPVALSRLDGLSIALALIAVAYLLGSNISGSALWLTLASWLKVWPVAVLASLFLPKENRLRVFRAALYTSVILVLVGFLLGANQNLFSFIWAQQNRGIQIESLIAMPWVWADVQNHGAHIYYDTHILTFQVRGNLTQQTSHSMGWFMLAALAFTAALTWFCKLREAPKEDLLALSAMAFTLDLILFNKVGSPQYLGWLIIPVLIGLGYRLKDWWPAVTGVLVATAITQVIYPNVYDALLEAQLWPVILLTVRNAIEVAIFVWVIWRLFGLAFKK